MKKYKHYLGAALGLLVLAIVVAVTGARVASANVEFFARTAQTATATTSPLFLQAATATSTAVVYDSYAQNSSAPANTKPWDGVLLIQVGATSTTPVLNITVEYSQDGTQANGASYDCTVNQAGCDWYSDSVVSPVAGTAVSLNFPKLYTLTGINGTSTRAIYLPTPTRYARVRVQAVGGPMNVWAQVVPAKESSK